MGKAGKIPNREHIGMPDSFGKPPRGAPHGSEVRLTPRAEGQTIAPFAGAPIVRGRQLDRRMLGIRVRWDAIATKRTHFPSCRWVLLTRIPSRGEHHTA